jgi:transcription antitermination factor NusG
LRSTIPDRSPYVVPGSSGSTIPDRCFRSNCGAENVDVVRPQVVDFPENPPPIDLFATTDPWYAVRVHGRREDKFVALMKAAGIPVFYPTELIKRRERRRERGRRHEYRYVTVRRSRWCGYCFIAADAEGIYAAKATNIVYKILPAKEQGQLVNALRRIHDYDVARGNRPEERFITPGSMCRVTGGAFVSFEGQWVAEKGGRGHLLCTFAGQPTPMHIDIELLEPI